MANTIQLRRSTSAAAAPASLASGEVAVNEADGILFYRLSGVVTGARLGAATASLPGHMSAAYATKLDGIATGATANSTDANLRDRTTHTGPQRSVQTTVSPSSGAITINLALGNTWLVDLTANVTAITISNPPASGTSERVVIYFKQDGTGGRTVAGWPAAVKWPGAVAPTVSSGANKIDSVVLDTFDGGTTYYGALAAQDYR